MDLVVAVELKRTTCNHLSLYLYIDTSTDEDAEGKRRGGQGGGGWEMLVVRR